MHTVRVTFPDGTTMVEVVDAPNQRDAHKLAQEWATAEATSGRESEPRPGTTSEIVRRGGTIMSRQ